MIVQMLNVPGLDRMTPDFRSELWRVATRLGLEAGYIAAVMAHESGFNPHAVNPTGGATGLIQFMPQTAKGLGTSVQALASMGAGEQLKYVEAFFRPYAPKMRKDVPGDYLMATFMPAFVGSPPDTVLFAKGTLGYTQNIGFDKTNKGTITVADVTTAIDKIVAAAQTRPSLGVDTTLPLGQTGGSSLPSPLPPSLPPYSSGPSNLPVLHGASRGSVASRGTAVVLWQRYLNHTAIVGTTCVVTGIFDAMTEEATRLYQIAKALYPDRIVGPLTWGTVLS